MDMADLDMTDRRILYELDWDARQPISRLAKKLGISKDVANYRIKKMMDSGVIKYFYPVVNLYKLGYFPYRVSLKLKNITYEQERSLINHLKSLDNIDWVVSCGGKWDLIFIVSARDVYDFQDFFADFLEKFGEYAEKSKIAMVHKLHLYTRGCLLGDEEFENFENKEIINEGKPTDLDDTDWDLLNLLGKDARMSLLSLSKSLGLSPNAVDYRMKRLIKAGVLQGFRMMPNFDMLGMKYFKVYFRFSKYDKSKISQILSYAKSNPFIVYIDEAFGGADLELEFQVNHRETFLKTLADFRNKFGNIIRDYDTITFYEEHKLKFVPPKPKKEGKDSQAFAEA